MNNTWIFTGGNVLLESSAGEAVEFIHSSIYQFCLVTETCIFLIIKSKTTFYKQRSTIHKENKHDNRHRLVRKLIGFIHISPAECSDMHM